MKSKQRKAKHKHAQQHSARQRERLAKALHDCQVLLNSNQHKRKTLADLMERCGYVPNGNGGWRRLATKQNKSIDKER